MGMFSSPSMPTANPELQAQKEAETARLKKEKDALDANLKNQERKRVANLIGQESLQSDEITGFTGFRQSKNMGKSIRS
jgi:uncharacterized protein YfeS